MENKDKVIITIRIALFTHELNISDFTVIISLGLISFLESCETQD